MEDIIRIIRQTVDAGRRFGKQGLLYEAAYRYGQAAAMIAMLYAMHTSGTVTLDPMAQSMLAPLHQKLEILAQSLARSAGNGRHALGSRESDAKDSLHRVIDMLLEDIEGTQWL